MADRAACERRVYRLAMLLTGNPELATGVITAVVDAQPNLDRLDSAHLDRLTVLHSREIQPKRLPESAVPRQLAEALTELPAQQREAWILKHVYRLPDRELARAMDCSTTATARHLELAEGAVRSSLGNAKASNAPGILLAYSMSLDVPAFYRARQRRRRLIRRLIISLIGLIVIAAAILIASWIAAAFGNGS